MMRSKLGLFQAHESDVQLISDLLDWMVDNNADYTNTFRSLSQLENLTANCIRGKSFKIGIALAESITKKLRVN